MKIIDLLKKKILLFPLKFFLQKQTLFLKNVRIATEKIAKLSPFFMSVTYGADDGISKYLDIAKRIK